MAGNAGASRISVPHDTVLLWLSVSWSSDSFA
jgi:hypothetical protein